MAEQEGSGQPAVMETMVLIDVAYLKGADKLALIVKHTDFIPLKNRIKQDCMLVKNIKVTWCYIATVSIIFSWLSRWGWINATEAVKTKYLQMQSNFQPSLTQDCFNITHCSQ